NKEAAGAANFTFSINTGCQKIHLRLKLCAEYISYDPLNDTFLNVFNASRTTTTATTTTTTTTTTITKCANVRFIVIKRAFPNSMTQNLVVLTLSDPSERHNDKLICLVSLTLNLFISTHAGRDYSHLQMLAQPIKKLPIHISYQSFNEGLNQFKLILLYCPHNASKLHHHFRWLGGVRELNVQNGPFNVSPDDI
uniref:Uncharacterized protein n=1 Tax=Glossina palpalis gambiensis TaxID=67801 RepID=A0A1B0API0_9MUSC